MRAAMLRMQRLSSRITARKARSTAGSTSRDLPCMAKWTPPPPPPPGIGMGVGIGCGMAETIEYRINDCFRRSMNGTALDPAGADMRDIVTYLAFLSRDVAVAPPA